MVGRIGKVSLGEEIEMLRDLEKTIRIARAKLALIVDATGDEETASCLSITAYSNLGVALDQTRLAIMRAQEAADEQIDDMVAQERGDDEAVSMAEDLGR